MRLADAPEVLTVDEAAAIARVGRNQMYAAVSRGDVWGARVGRSIRIPKVALVAFLRLDNEAAGVRTSPTALEVGRASDRTTAQRS